MSCFHKFYGDLNLQYADWEVRTLFIGTFNPGWPGLRNNAQWFYGRTQKNAFWCILHQIHGGLQRIESRAAWLDFCRDHHLGITDILSVLQTADEGNPTHFAAIQSFKDDYLEAFAPVPTNIPDILDRHPNIRQICLTRMSSTPFWEQQFRPMREWVATHSDRNIRILSLRSPSRGARRGVVGNFCEFVANKWLEQGYSVEQGMFA